jgi:hypothetical protein
MQSIYAIAIVAMAVAFLFLVARSARRRWRSAPGARPAAEAETAGELVAVIAAAVAAASGMEPGGFRIASVSPAAPPYSRSGFNTPVWGHVDRNNFGEQA